MTDLRCPAIGDHYRITTSYDVINFCSISLVAINLASTLLRLFRQWLVAKRDWVSKCLQLRISTFKKKTTKNKRKKNLNKSKQKEKENRTVTGPANKNKY